MKVFILASLIALSFASKVEYRPISERFLKDPAKKVSYIDASRSRGGSSRIVGGNDATPGQFPYQAALNIDFPLGSSFCGGSLITTKSVLTAAHCVKGCVIVKVTLGAYNIQLNEASQVHYRVVCLLNVKVHKDWNPTLIQNDIALVKLNYDVISSNFIKPIKLPQSSEINVDLTDEICTVSGWGLTEDGAKFTSPELQFVNLRIISNPDCDLAYGGEGLITDEHLCTDGGDGRSTCSGDSGGPLTISKGDDDILIGVVSFVSSSGCEAGFPAGYTRVTKYLDWIADINRKY